MKERFGNQKMVAPTNVFKFKRKIKKR